MPKNYFLIGIIVVVAVVVGTIFFEQSRKNEPMRADISDSIEGVQTPVDGISAAPPIQENSVAYSDAGYSPAVLKVRVGTTVTFKNESSALMRLASDPHPLHNAYPTTGGCAASTFDSCREIARGGSWQFQFDVVGTWKYHNHLNPNQTGTIIVE